MQLLMPLLKGKYRRIRLLSSPESDGSALSKPSMYGPLLSFDFSRPVTLLSAGMHF